MRGFVTHITSIILMAIKSMTIIKTNPTKNDVKVLFNFKKVLKVKVTDITKAQIQSMRT